MSVIHRGRHCVFLEISRELSFHQPPTCLSATSPPHSHYLLTAVTLLLCDSAGKVSPNSTLSFKQISDPATPRLSFKSRCRRPHVQLCRFFFFFFLNYYFQIRQTTERDGTKFQLMSVFKSAASARSGRRSHAVAQQLQAAR